MFETFARHRVVGQGQLVDLGAAVVVLDGRQLDPRMDAVLTLTLADPFERADAAQRELTALAAEPPGGADEPLERPDDQYVGARVVGAHESPPSSVAAGFGIRNQ